MSWKKKWAKNIRASGGCTGFNFLIVFIINACLFCFKLEHDPVFSLKSSLLLFATGAG